MVEVIRIVIADDVAEMLSALVLTLRSISGVEVVATAASADEVVAAVQATRPDLALIDLHMPGGGLVACDRIRAEAPATAVVMMSVMADGRTRAEALRWGALDFVPKGVGAEAFRERLEACVERVRTTRGP